MSAESPYASSSAVEAAIKSAARAMRQRDASLNVGALVRQAYFDRFLCRVFSEGAESEWVLKGGTGMLARVPSSRATLDVDLYRTGFSLDQVLEDLRRLAEVDLGDYFRFVYTGHRTVVAGEAQPYTEGYRVAFTAYLGVKKLTSFHVDLAIGAGVTGSIDTTTPANRLNLPRLPATPYRLYPVVDQVADKVCATMTTYHGRPSSREKDLVDLVVIATTHRLEAASLAIAIDTERRRRRLGPFGRFTVPGTWGRSYSAMARTVPACGQHQRIEAATALVQQLLDPVLAGERTTGTWDPHRLAWG